MLKVLPKCRPQLRRKSIDSSRSWKSRTLNENQKPTQSLNMSGTGWGEIAKISYAGDRNLKQQQSIQ